MFFEKLSGFQLKYLALFCMLADHFAVIFQKELPVSLYFILRSAGRLAFPLFAFFLTEGFFHTQNLRKYGERLLLFALISEIPFDLALGSLSDLSSALARQNVFFTLFFGFLALALAQQAGNTPSGILSFAILFALINEVCRGDGGAPGILCIILFYIFRKSQASDSGLPVICGMISISPLVLASVFSFPAEIVSFAAAIFLRCYNGKKGRGKKYFFYLFYPLHLLFLLLISYSFSI
ncbi:MAG: conjugal transfer protein TraX [Eubacterium sp.]|nr:conjugal transfer protein TraX [Eubacterium sp.]MDD7210146.1 TraX family protein [Lachnospiraceae bacterium]MDY5498361.1 TraX family protein [Anaerobutyricum sp.]